MFYELGDGVEAFSTERTTLLDFDVVLPQHQAHGTRVVRVPASEADLTGCDALITNEHGLRIGVKTADCVPVLIYDVVHQAVAAIHSGWRGTVANIVSAVLRAMRDAYGTVPSDCRAVIGPCIHVKAFEVGDDLYDTFVKAGYGAQCQRLPHPDTGAIKWHIDLPAICRKQLADSGVTDIDVCPVCTYEQHQRFYSARRLGAAFGKQRILNCIMLKE